MIGVEARAWSRGPARTVVNRLRDNHGLSPRDIGTMVRLYREGKGLKEIAVALEIAWPVVHIAIFELRRAGVDLPNRTKEARR